MLFVESLLCIEFYEQCAMFEFVHVGLTNLSLVQCKAHLMDCVLGIKCMGDVLHIGFVSLLSCSHSMRNMMINCHDLNVYPDPNCSPLL